LHESALDAPYYKPISRNLQDNLDKQRSDFSAHRLFCAGLSAYGIIKNKIEKILKGMEAEASEIGFMECKWPACLPGERIPRFFSSFRCGRFLPTGNENAAGAGRN
jgi:hypothetical protein